jgi:hypothetical protein
VPPGLLPMMVFCLAIVKISALFAFFVVQKSASLVLGSSPHLQPLDVDFFISNFKFPMVNPKQIVGARLAVEPAKMFTSQRDNPTIGRRFNAGSSSSPARVPTGRLMGAHR